MLSEWMDDWMNEWSTNPYSPVLFLLPIPTLCLASWALMCFTDYGSKLVLSAPCGLWSLLQRWPPACSSHTHVLHTPGRMALSHRDLLCIFIQHRLPDQCVQVPWPRSLESESRLCHPLAGSPLGKSVPELWFPHLKIQVIQSLLLLSWWPWYTHIYSFNKHSWVVHYVPGSKQDKRPPKTKDQTQIPALLGLTLLLRRQAISKTDA